MDFVQILTKITTSHQSDSDLMDAFEVFDREEKGFFRLHELEEALNEMPGSELMTENELADILQLADPDGDGHVSFEGLCEVNLDPDMRRKCSPPPSHHQPVGIACRGVLSSSRCPNRDGSRVLKVGERLTVGDPRGGKAK